MDPQRSRKARIAGLSIFFFFILLTVLWATLISGCGKDKIIIRYLRVPGPVSLISPAIDSFLTADQPTFYWHRLDGAVRYQIQVASASDFISRTIDASTAETTYTTISQIPNNTYFWRVRGQNADTIWGDWSDAEIRTFFKSNYVNYIDLLSSIHTYGIAQDVYVRNDTAYVADGQADLTIIDVQDKGNPFIIRNLDTFDDDFAFATYVAPGDTVPYAFVGDRDGRIQAIYARADSAIFNNAFGEQNIKDIFGQIITDTLYVFAVRSRSGFNLASLNIYQIVFDPLNGGIPRTGDDYFVNPINMPANPEGVVVEGDYAFVASGDFGLAVVDIRDIRNPFVVTSLVLDGTSLGLAVDGDFAYIAADRSGLYVVDITDRANPAVVDQVNTSGRSKDISTVGDYAFVADGSGGLKVIDISAPDSSFFVAAYATPYAYGVWADSGYVYICDRDEGLMIFENRVSR